MVVFALLRRNTNILNKQNMTTEEIIKKVQSFEDACQVLGLAIPEGLPELLQPKNAEIVPPNIVALMKLQIITAALNQGWTWVPDGETRAYYAWFWFFTQEELDKMDASEKESRHIIPADGFSKFAGLGSGDSCDAWTYSTADVGARLAYRNGAIARHSARQFIDLWKQYLFE